MPRKVQQIPDYFTPEEAAALVQAAPSYPTRMAFRLMLKTGLRVSEALALRRVDLRLDQDPLFNVNYFCRLASIILAGSPPYPAPAAGPLRSGSWGR